MIKRRFDHALKTTYFSPETGVHGIFEEYGSMKKNLEALIEAINLES